MNDDETKENFCPSCLTIPLAMSGVGLSIYGDKGNQTDQNYRNKKKYILYIGILITVISFFISIYFLCFKQCKECR